jgi:hypothetical protein
MSYVFNFVVEILLISTYDLRPVDQIMNDSPFYVMWVVGLEVHVTRNDEYEWVSGTLSWSVLHPAS